jgi:hypothetical protein
MNRTAWLQERRMLKFRDVLSRWETSELSALEASELLGMSERRFRRYRARFEGEGSAGLLDRRLGKASPRRVPESDRERMLDFVPGDVSGLERSAFSRPVAEPSRVFMGLQLDEDAAAAGWPRRAHRKRGPHRRKRERKPYVGMMLHQDGSRVLAFGRAGAGPDRDDG